MMGNEASTPSRHRHLSHLPPSVGLRSPEDSGVVSSRSNRLDTPTREPAMQANTHIQDVCFSSHVNSRTDEPAPKRCRRPSPGGRHDNGMTAQEIPTVIAISDTEAQNKVNPDSGSKTARSLWCFLCQKYRDMDNFSLEQQRLGNACGKFAFCRMHSAKERRMKHFSRIAMGFQDPGSDTNGAPLVDSGKLMLAEYGAMMRSGEAMNSDGEFVNEDAEEGEITSDDDDDDDSAHKDEDDYYNIFISESDFQQMMHNQQESVIDLTHDDVDSDELADTIEAGEKGLDTTTSSGKSDPKMRGSNCQQQHEKRLRVGKNGAAGGGDDDVEIIFEGAPPSSGLPGDLGPDKEEDPAARPLLPSRQAVEVASPTKGNTMNGKGDDDDDNDDDVAHIMLSLQKEPSASAII